MQTSCLQCSRRNRENDAERENWKRVAMRVSKLPFVVAMALLPLVFFQFHLDTQGLGSLKTLVRHNNKPRKTKTLQFAPCESFEDHRLGVALGVLLAKYLGRTIILPGLRSNSSPSIPLSNLYEESELLQTLEKYQIPSMTSLMPVPTTTKNDVVSCGGMDPSTVACMEMVKGQYHVVDDLVFECPFPNPSVSPEYVSLHADLFWDVLGALQPSSRMGELVRSQLSAIESAFNDTNFHFVDGSEGEVDLMTAVKVRGLDSERGFYLTQSVGRIEEAAGWLTARQLDLSMLTGKFLDVHKGMLDFHMGLASTKSLSDPRTTFGGLLMMERRHKGLFSSGYVGERLGLNKRIPLFKLPWVVFHNTGDENLEYMLKVAVRSANHGKALWPVCVVSGHRSDMSDWLSLNNVTVIFHEASWLEEFFQGEEAALKRASQFKLQNEGKVISVGNALQIEIPKIDILRQFEYVMYTGPRILFRRRLSLDLLAGLLPSVVGVVSSVDSIEQFPFEASVALWNISAACDNYESLVAHVTDPKRKPRLLSLKAGARTQSMQEAGKSWAFPEHVVETSYMGYDVKAHMVDFSGMAPHEYARYARAGACVHNICYDGILRGWCGYIFEWSSFLEEEEADAGLPVMKECVQKVCSFRGGCRRWKQAISDLVS